MVMGTLDDGSHTMKMFDTNNEGTEFKSMDLQYNRR